MNPLSGSAAILCVGLLALVPLAPAGVAFINTGLGRSRSAAQSLLGALCLAAIAAIVYFAFGYCFEGAAAGHAVNIGGAAWDWAGASAPFFQSLTWTGSPASYAAAFQLFAVALVVLIPWGSGADRWSLGAACASTILLAGFVYPLFAHWVWAGGWLSQLGAAFHLGRGFVDPSGAATIQVLGGLSALSIVWILGPRRGKFIRGGPPAVIPAHHIAYVLFGCFVAFVGWLALNLLGAVLFARIDGADLVLTEVNTFLCASGALVAVLLVTRIRFGKPDASLCANGWIGGLVVSSALAALVTPLAALFAGFIAGAALPPAIEFLELRCGIDDPTGGVVVHGLSGIWGLLAVGFLAQAPAGQMLAQIVGVATLLGLVLPAIYLLNWLLDKVIRFRTNLQGERLGMDLHELGAGAYPEFVTHNDEFIPH